MIPVCEPTLAGKEQEYVLTAVKSGWISSSGAFLEKFESEFPKKVGAKYGTAVCNGTVALHLALKAAGIQEGDEVIVPSFTMIATANAVKYCGAEPIFVDADPFHWTLDVQQLEKLITTKTKAIISVTIYGHPCDYKALGEIVNKHRLIWIEDAAEGHGATAYEEPLAQGPALTVYSFFANKIITTGEGGMVCTNHPDLWKKSRYLKNLAFPIDGPRNYIHKDIGFNYRMTNLQAALGCAQTERFDDLVKARQQNAVQYQTRLKKIGDYVQLQAEAPWAKSVYWMFGILLKDTVKANRDTVMMRLKEKGIDTRPFFHPMHLQPIFAPRSKLPVSEHLGERGLYLPSSSHLSENQISEVCKALEEVVLN